MSWYHAWAIVALALPVCLALGKWTYRDGDKNTLVGVAFYLLLWLPPLYWGGFFK